MKNFYYIFTIVKIQKEEPKGKEAENVLVTYGFHNAQKVKDLCMEGDKIGAYIAANRGLREEGKNENYHSIRK